MTQLSRSTIDTINNILKHFAKHTQQNVTHSHSKQVNEDTPVKIISDTQQSNMHEDITGDRNQNQIAVNNE